MVETNTRAAGRRIAAMLIGATLWVLATAAQAQWTPTGTTVVSDSEEPFSRRIYSYDIDYDSSGNVHIIYAKPVLGQGRAEIIYARRLASGWQSTVLESDGKLDSISTFLVIDRNSDLAHVSYIRYQNDPQTELVYQTIRSGSPSVKTKVEAGGWHTRMELDHTGRSVFVRQGIRSLRLFVPSGPAEWQQRSMSISPAGASNYRIGDFKYDVLRRNYHIVYGDSTAFHNLWYATSGNGWQWQSSQVDNSSTLYELEFWVSLVIDRAGIPHCGMYKYNTYGGQPNTGTSLLYAWRSGSTWQKSLIAGARPGAPADHRAGMGVGMAVDNSNRIHGMWDNSPDYPIDFYGALGNIAYRYGAWDRAWTYKQQVKPFSLEGTARMVVNGNKLHVLCLANFADAKLYLLDGTVHSGSPAQVGGGWEWVPWFSFFYPHASSGWIFHMQHGWVYPFSSLLDESVVFWDDGMQDYWWTRWEMYPTLYRFSDQAWLWYLPGSVNPRWFVDLATGVWEAH